MDKDFEHTLEQITDILSQVIRYQVKMTLALDSCVSLIKRLAEISQGPPSSLERKGQA
jgi:hypothetical protein